MDKNIEYIIEVVGIEPNSNKRAFFKLDYDLIQKMLKSKSVEEMVGVIVRGEIVAVYGDEIDTGISADPVDWGETKAKRNKELKYFLDNVKGDLNRK